MVLLVDSAGSKAGKTLSVCGLVSWAPGSLAPCSEACRSLRASRPAPALGGMC